MDRHRLIACLLKPQGDRSINVGGANVADDSWVHHAGAFQALGELAAQPLEIVPGIRQQNRQRLCPLGKGPLLDEGIKVLIHLHQSIANCDHKVLRCHLLNGQH
jgi:hypothetical protein